MSSTSRAEFERQAGASLLPGLIRFTRRLSVDGEPLVQPGQWVDADTPLLAMHTFPGRVLRNQVAAELRISPVDTEDALVAGHGRMLAVGDILARSSMFWGHRVARSQYEGSVAGVSPSLGVVYMREHIPTQIAETVRINVIEELGGNKNHFSSYVKVKDGDRVEKGQVIATRQEGHHYSNIFSPVFGTVAHVAPLLGALSIIPDRVSSVVTAHVPGVVMAIRDNREVDLAGHGVIFEGLVGLGGEAHGELAVVANSPSPWRPDADVETCLSGRVIVCGFVDDESLRLAAGCGVMGVIAGRAHQAALCRFAGRELGVIATGDEDVPVVLVLTEGFGSGTISPRVYDLLKGFAGKLVSVSGTTHIRAGVIRPKIIVSLPPPDGFDRAIRMAEPTDEANPSTVHPDSAAGPATIGLVEMPVELAPGLRARVLRGPYAGGSGTIVDLPLRARAIETGAEVLVAIVRLDQDPAPAGVDQACAGHVVVAQANLKLEWGIDGDE